MIRSQMLFKNVNSLYMNELVKGLNDTQRGIFMSQGKSNY